MIIQKKEESSLSLPDLPEIPMNTQPKLIENSLPLLPEYPKEEKKITVVEVKDDLYSSDQMEKSLFDKNSTILEPPPERKVIIKNEIPNNKNYIKKDNEIFVKIKKFEAASINFDEIKLKIDEMQKDLEKAKRLIKEETKELEEWEKEITQIKKGMDEIDRNLFTEIEKGL